MGIQILRKIRIVERLLLHDVAPVARRIPDADENRHAAFLRVHEGFIAPWVPVHRVVRVLAQVGAGFEEQAVAVEGRTIGPDIARTRHVVRAACYELLRQPLAKLRGERRCARLGLRYAPELLCALRV